MSDGSSIFAHCLVVFFLTFAFIGLEYVAMEVDDPFGDDANDVRSALFYCDTIAFLISQHVCFQCYYIQLSLTTLAWQDPYLKMSITL